MILQLILEQGQLNFDCLSFSFFKALESMSLRLYSSQVFLSMAKKKKEFKAKQIGEKIRLYMNIHHQLS